MTSKRLQRPHGILLPAALALGFMLGSGNGALANAPGPTVPWNIIPGTFVGNFVADNDQQVCFELEIRDVIDDVTTDMVGVRVDPPVSYMDDFIMTTLSADGKFLEWDSTNATVHAIVVKGGPNYNVYDYADSGITEDGHLHSPLHGRRIPAISHYNICYTPEQEEARDGCTPGYWRNHADRWSGVIPSEDFDTTFGVDLFSPDITLGAAVKLNGGGSAALARHATAALLNADGGVPNSDGTTVNYTYTVDEVIQLVQDAVANSTIEATKNLLEAANNSDLGQVGTCPLSGTSVVPIP